MFVMSEADYNLLVVHNTLLGRCEDVKVHSSDPLPEDEKVDACT